MSFLVCEAKSRLGAENKLVRLSRLIDWGRIGSRLKGLHSYEINGNGGNKPYDSLKMFKAVLLGQWHDLSDPELEESLKIRLDFMAFTGLEGEVPDETTLCRFRNKLIELGLDKVLFSEINRQLERVGLKVKECKGAVIDATIIESAARPNKIIEAIPEDRQEQAISSDQPPTAKIQYSKDPDAAWLKKGKRCYYGYKGFIATDVKDGYIENVYMTPANESEVCNMENTLGNIEPERVYADKGYASAKNREHLKSKNIKDGIMSKANRNKQLTNWEKIRNKLISTKRFIVEQAFGTLKRRFKIARATYTTMEKVLGQLTLKSICFNLLKALNKAEFV